MGIKNICSFTSWLQEAPETQEILELSSEKLRVYVSPPAFRHMYFSCTPDTPDGQLFAHKPALQKSPGHSRGDRTYPPVTLLELKNRFLFLLFTAEIELCGLLRCPLTPNLLVGSSFCSKFHESVPSPASQEICRLKRQN